MAGGLEHARDRTAPNCRLPDAPGQALCRKQCSGGLGRGLVEIVASIDERVTLDLA
jgi:hypothetical protein